MNRSKDLDTVAPDDEVVSTKKNSSKLEPEIPVVDKKSSQNIYNLLGHTKTPFSSFLIHPKVLSFSEQDKDEEIYLALRPHWATNIYWIFFSVLMLFVPLFFKYFTFLNFFPSQYQFAATLFWYLITFIYAFEKFLSWYFDLFLVTNKRLVDIEFNNLLNKHFAEADVDMIQDVSSCVRGLFGTFFNFGDVLIQTASEINQITFEKVPNPEKVIKLLEELRNLSEKRNKEDHHHE